MLLTNYSTKYFGTNKALASYLNDIRPYKVPTVEEEEELFRRYKDGDMKAKQEIVNRNQRFVYAVAKVYARNEDEVLDFVNEGNIGLLEAIEKFDIDKGMKFITWAVFFIRREMNYFLNTTNKAIKQSNAFKLSKKVERVKERYYAENGINASDEDIIEIIHDVYGIRIKDKMDVKELVISSINEGVWDDDNREKENAAGEYNEKTASSITFNTEIERDYNTKLVNSILKKLPDRYKDIIIDLFGIGKERPLSVKEASLKYDKNENDINSMKNMALEYLKQNRSKISLAV